MNRKTPPARPFPPLLAPLLAPLLVLTALVAPAPALAPASTPDGQKYDVKLDLKEGQAWDFDLRNESDVKQQYAANGQQQVVESGNASVRKGTVRVLAVKDGVPTALKVTFDKACATAARKNGQNVSTPFPLAGKTVTVRADASGAVTHDAGGLGAGDADAATELEKLLEADRSVYPPHPVAVGDEWDADTRGIARRFQLGADDHAAVKCKLLRIGSVGGRKTADVSSAGTVRKGGRGNGMTLHIGGVTQIDLATGQPLQTDVIWKITTRETAQANGPEGPVPMQVSGDWKVQTHQTISPVRETGEGTTAPADAGKPPTAPGTPDAPGAPHGSATPDAGGGTTARSGAK